MPLKAMASQEQNFGSPNETLEAPMKHWKNFFLNIA
jgi:hypothetical protein